MTPAEMYQKLSARFDQHHTRRSGAGELTYVTGEQVVSRLNAVLGFDGWIFRVKEHGIHAEADEIWVLGEMVVNAGDMLAPITREQFGSQKINRARSNGVPLDIGFDLKGAATDALKKCASLIGVGLYLSSKDEMGSAPAMPPAQAPKPGPRPAEPAPARPRGGPAPSGESDQLGVQRQIRERLLDGWAAVWNKAQQLGLQVDVIDVMKMSNLELSTAGAELKARVEAEMDRIEAARV